jgi:hypothetical protein
MGTLNYGSRVTLDVDDRSLTHLQIVIIGKLRRGEGFAFSWRTGGSAGDERSTVWMHAGVDLQFVFTGGTPSIINRSWLGLLNQAANSNGGLQLLPEPDVRISGEGGKP